MKGEEYRYPPLELGTVSPGGSAEAGSSPDSAFTPGTRSPATPPWRRWAALATALAVGAVIGVVGNNARNNAAQYSQVELVSGPVEAQYSSQEYPDTLLVSLINTGPRDVEVIGVDVHGFTTPPGAEPPEPVTAVPGDWVRFQTKIQADCEARPSSAMRVRVRTESGEQVVGIDPPPGDSGLRWAWDVVCSPSFGAGLYVGEARTVSSGGARVEIALPVTNDGSEPVEIVSMDSTTPGFAADVHGLPLEVGAGGFGTLETIWTVVDCTATERLTEVNITLDAVEGTTETRFAQPLGNRTLIELAQLAVRSCET